ADHDRVVGQAEGVEDPGQLAVPVLPGGGVGVLPGGPVPGQAGHLAGVPALGQRLAPRLHRPRSAGEAVAQQDPDPASAGALRARGDGERSGELVDSHGAIMPSPGRGRSRALGCASWMFYWFSKWVALGPWLKVVFRPQTEGADHVPVEGPAILASNHL
ncbi:hypothetical protein OY671_010563, partial [Metschnikowia pulcherrima]